MHDFTTFFRFTFLFLLFVIYSKECTPVVLRNVKHLKTVESL